METYDVIYLRYDETETSTLVGVHRTIEGARRSLDPKLLSEETMIGDVYFYKSARIVVKMVED